MLYELPRRMRQSFTPVWSKGVGNIPAVLPDGTEIGVPVYFGINVVTLGITGTGKTTSYTHPAARHLLESTPHIKGVFLETKRTFLDTFLKDDDKVIAYEPNIVPSGNLFQWCMIKEIRQAKDQEGEMRQIAEALFAELLLRAEQNRAWVESARNTFIAVLRTIVYCTSDNTSNWNLVNALRQMTIPELLRYISKHPRNHALLSKDFGYDPSKADSYVPTKRAMDIMFFFNQILETFGGSFESKDGEDSIYDYLSGKYGKNLFLLHNLATAESSRPFIVYFLKKIKDEKMSLSSTFKESMLWCLDEADKLAEGGKTADFGLYQAATLGREYGLQILLTTQSIESLYGLAPDFNAHITNSGLAGFPIIVAFRPGDPNTLTTLQTLYGSERHNIMTMPASRYDHPVVKSELEPIVSEADFASLETGEAYVKIQSHRPLKVHFTLQST